MASPTRGFVKIVIGVTAFYFISSRAVPVLIDSYNEK
jgi:hypothetical protein